MKRVKIKNFGATQTAQNRSLINLTENKSISPVKTVKNEQIKLMLSLCDSANELYEKLSMLSNALGKKIEEQSLYKEVNK